MAADMEFDFSGTYIILKDNEDGTSTCFLNLPELDVFTTSVLEMPLMQLFGLFRFMPEATLAELNQDLTMKMTNIPNTPEQA